MRFVRTNGLVRVLELATLCAAGAALALITGGCPPSSGSPTETPAAPTQTPTAPATQTPSPIPTTGAAVSVSQDDSSITFTFGNGVVLRARKLAAGSFVMGSPLGQGGDEERPQRTVNVSAFAIGETEVTQAQWKAVMGTDPSALKGDSRPVEQVSWDDAVAFCQQLADLSAQTVRLPTEAEWEFACRAGSTTAYSFGDDAANLGDYAWYGNNSGFESHNVGEKSPNAWGLYDTHGNVFEWCSDWYASDYYGTRPDPDTAPQGPATGNRRVVRGGSRGNLASTLRSSYRLGQAPDSSTALVGFRVAVGTR